MLSIAEYSTSFNTYLEDHLFKNEPKNLYDPINYILELGGKRLRPVLTLMSASIFGADYKQALDAALAVEIFHNFSLMHDDIMDDAPLRRGKVTVHEKWDISTGILSGDAMLINAYQLFENYEGDTFKQLAKLFTKTAIEVCEGQQYDVDFESRDDVTLAEYLKMIEFKTAVLVGASLKMGAIVANASNACSDYIYEFGRDLGIAFQLQDDYLDAFGNPETFGKQVGGDIIENKKTYLYLIALDKLKTSDAQELRHLYSIHPNDPAEKIAHVKGLFEDSGVVASIKEEITFYTNRALAVLDKISITPENKKLLTDFAMWLMQRKV